MNIDRMSFREVLRLNLIIYTNINGTVDDDQPYRYWYFSAIAYHK
jgi:hypothetical protein